MRRFALPSAAPPQPSESFEFASVSEVPREPSVPCCRQFRCLSILWSKRVGPKHCWEHIGQHRPELGRGNSHLRNRSRCRGSGLLRGDRQLLSGGSQWQCSCSGAIRRSQQSTRLPAGGAHIYRGNRHNIYSHRCAWGEMYLGDYSIPAPGQPAQFSYSDFYNFGYFEGSNSYYRSSFDWVGPGPERQTRKSSVQTGNTIDRGTVQIPDHLSVVSDTTTTYQCDVGTRKERKINYIILDSKQNFITRPVSVQETIYSPTSSCTDTPIYTTFDCMPTPSGNGNFTDILSAGCPKTTQLAQSCGVTIPDQKWEWCSTAALPRSIGNIGQILLYNSFISLRSLCTSSASPA